METQQTFFIQCNREMSVIDNEDPELNSIWTTNLGTAGFQLQRGGQRCQPPARGGSFARYV